MTRRCSHCGNNGHNARTCPSRSGGGGGVRLFGVRLTSAPAPMKKSASMSCIASSLGGGSVGLSPPAGAAGGGRGGGEGYVSDDPAHVSRSVNGRAERKKGTPWTEEEHRMFLMGLQKLGKGDWRGISRNFVVSRSPTQVGSSTLLDRQTHQDGRGHQACLIWSLKCQWTSPLLLQNNFLVKIIKRRLQVQMICYPYMLGYRRMSSLLNSCQNCSQGSMRNLNLQSLHCH